MFKIGDFSKLTQISVRMLRYYEEKGLLIPIHKVKNSNYRYYAVSQIPTVNKIKALRDLGMSVTAIRDALQYNDVELLAALNAQQKQIQQQMKTQQQQVDTIQRLQKSMLEEYLEPFEVTIKTIPPQWVVSYRSTMADYYEEQQLWNVLHSEIKRYHIPVTNDTVTLAIFHDGEDIDVEVCIGVESPVTVSSPLLCRELEAVPQMASVHSYGSFANIGKTYERIASWISNNAYTIAGNTREIPIIGPWNNINEEEYLIEIQVPIKKIKIGG